MRGNGGGVQSRWGKQSSTLQLDPPSSHLDDEDALRDGAAQRVHLR
jgi:hypothetical protein